MPREFFERPRDIVGGLGGGQPLSKSFFEKIIGGLILVSLLSRPAVINTAAYNALKEKNDSKIIFVIKKEDDEKKQTEALDDLLGEIESGSRRITNLLGEKNRLLSRIDTTLYLHSRTRAILEENQIKGFAAFCSYYNDEIIRLKDNLEKSDLREILNCVKKELLNKDSNYELVYDELKTVKAYQNLAIKNLSGIIDAGNGVLEQIYDYQI